MHYILFLHVTLQISKIPKLVAPHMFHLLQCCTITLQILEKSHFPKCELFSLHTTLYFILSFCYKPLLPKTSLIDPNSPAQQQWLPQSPVQSSPSDQPAPPSTSASYIPPSPSLCLSLVSLQPEFPSPGPPLPHYPTRSESLLPISAVSTRSDAESTGPGRPTRRSIPGRTSTTARRRRWRRSSPVVIMSTGSL